jgi:pyruvate formate lyase activating enzyme
MVREFGLAVKLDTAGLLPDRLAEADVDYVAMDLKTAPDRYGELGWRGGDAEERLRQSVTHLIESNRDHELRTTVVPTLVGPEELSRMAVLAKGVRRWILQPYRRGRTLDPDWSDLTPVDDETLGLWADDLRSRGLPVSLRS